MDCVDPYLDNLPSPVNEHKMSSRTQASDAAGTESVGTHPSSRSSTPLVVTICNGTDYVGSPAWDQIERAKLVGCVARGLSAVQLVALTYGFGPDALRVLRRSGYSILDASATPASDFSLSRNSRLPHSLSTQPTTPKRPDSTCTAVKLLAWNLTQFPQLLLSDTDVLLRADPLPWMQEQARSQRYFIAEPETAGRGYPGFNTHLVFLTPNAQVFEILRTAAVYGNFQRYTDTDQDVVESVFSARQPMPPLLPNLHSKSAAWCHQRTVFSCALEGRSRCRVVSVANDTCCPRSFNRPSPHCCQPRLGCCRAQRAKWLLACHRDHATGRKADGHCAALLRDAGIDAAADPTLVQELNAILASERDLGRR
jgi:hypothetical protein